MKKIIFIFLIFFNSLVYSQIESHVRADSSSKNEITVIQSGNDSSKLSNIDLIKSDSNYIQVKQYDNSLEDKSGFWGWLTNLNNIIALIVGVITILGAIGGFKYYRNKKK